MKRWDTKIVISQGPLGVSNDHNILTVSDASSGIFDDTTANTVLGYRYSKIEVPVEREDGTQICTVLVTSDLRYIKRVSSTNNTRIAYIYYLHAVDRANS